MAEPPRSTMDTTNASQSNGSTDAPDVVMVDNANRQEKEKDQESSLLTKKRKATDDNAPASASLGANSVPDTADELAVQSKKAKLDAPNILADISLLPAEVWQHIFSFCPPRTLGNLLMVNKLFNSYLDPASSVVVEKRPPTTAKSAVKYVQPNALWRHARRSFWPNMPAPLKGKFELDMWRLACSSTCQFCGRRDPKRTQSTSDPLRFGPGVDGVSRIWDFRVRCCGTCLSRNTMTVGFLTCLSWCCNTCCYMSLLLQCDLTDCLGNGFAHVNCSDVPHPSTPLCLCDLTLQHRPTPRHPTRPTASFVHVNKGLLGVGRRQLARGV